LGPTSETLLGTCITTIVYTILGGRDACQGDSGGPLLCEIDGQVVLAGVTSWGIGCAEAKHPGEWAKISNFIDWIEPRMNSGKIHNQVTRMPKPTTTPAPVSVAEKKVPLTQSQKLRIRRYCQPAEDGADLREYTEINIGMEGKEKRTGSIVSFLCFYCKKRWKET